MQASTWVAKGTLQCIQRERATANFTAVVIERHLHCTCSYACRTSQARRANGVCAGETGTLLGPVSDSLWRRSSRPRFRFHHASCMHEYICTASRVRMKTVGMMKEMRRPRSLKDCLLNQANMFSGEDPLPQHWVRVLSRGTGQMYYASVETGVTQREKLQSVTLYKVRTK